MSCIAIIPARSGSKGLPNKNIKEFCGEPLIYWTIEAAKNSGCFDEIVVSTDSQEYKDICENLGANVPFLRSEATSLDTSATREVVLEVIEFYKKQAREFDEVCILQPTSPLRTSYDIKRAFKVKQAFLASGIISVTELEYPNHIVDTLDSNFSFKDFGTKYEKEESKSIFNRKSYRRQDNETLYRINGAIYIFDVSFYIDNENIYNQDVHAFVMPWSHSIDIDNEDDFMLAEYLASREWK